MSIVLGYSCKAYSIIVTDTRVCRGWSMDNIYDYTDDNEKLQNVTSGWVAGVGGDKFIREFKTYLESDSVSSSSDLLRYFNSAHSNAKKNENYDDEIVQITGIATSWITQNDMGLDFRVSIHSESMGGKDNYGRLKENYIYVMYPYEFTKSDALLIAFEDIHDFNYVNYSNVNDLILKMAQIFKDVFSISDTVSKVIDIGYLGFVGSEIGKFRIRMDVDELINDYPNNFKNLYIEKIDL